MKISTFFDESNDSDSNAVVYTSDSGPHSFELIALNVPRVKTQSVKNTINLLCRRRIQQGQIVFSEGLEFRTCEAKGDMRSMILTQFMPEADSQSKVMTLLPLHGSTKNKISTNDLTLSEMLSTAVNS